MILGLALPDDITAIIEERACQAGQTPGSWLADRITLSIDKHGPLLMDFESRIAEAHQRDHVLFLRRESNRLKQRADNIESKKQ